jgi:hypothetical protein
MTTAQIFSVLLDSVEVNAEFGVTPDVYGDGTAECEFMCVLIGGKSIDPACFSADAIVSFEKQAEAQYKEAAEQRLQDMFAEAQ